MCPVIYVDGSVPQSGDGTVEAPFKTITEAKEYAGQIRKTTNETIEVIIREGEYNLEATLKFKEADSNMTYRAYGSEEVILDGGGKDISISEFDVAEDERIPESAKENVLKVNLRKMGIEPPKVGIVGHDTNSLGQSGISFSSETTTVYSDGVRMNIARYPDEGYMTVDRVIEKGSMSEKTPMIFSAYLS